MGWNRKIGQKKIAIIIMTNKRMNVNRTKCIFVICYHWLDAIENESEAFDFFWKMHSPQNYYRFAIYQQKNSVHLSSTLAKETSNVHVNEKLFSYRSMCTIVFDWLTWGWKAGDCRGCDCRVCDAALAWYSCSGGQVTRFTPANKPKYNKRTQDLELSSRHTTIISQCSRRKKKKKRKEKRRKAFVMKKVDKWETAAQQILVCLV